MADTALRDIGARLAGQARRPVPTLLAQLCSSKRGLTEAAANDRLESVGENVIARDRQPHWLLQLLVTFKNPFIVVLLFLAVILTLTGDVKGYLTISTMVAVSVVLRFRQEYRSSRAAAALQALVTVTATVIRRAAPGRQPVAREVPFRLLVPGDIVRLSAGDLVPADCRLLTANDLYVSETSLTGEALPVQKSHRPPADGRTGGDGLRAPNLCLLGTSVVSGTAKALIVATGSATYFGSMASALVDRRPDTSFDRGGRSVTWTLIRFTAALVPVVLLLNGFTKGDWVQAALFAVSVAVGLTPEMLPMIVTANLARGAATLSRRGVVVKRLHAIQNLGAMDVLCTDKTGTLTDRIVLRHHLDVDGAPVPWVLELSYLTSWLQTGPQNVLDEAIINRVGTADRLAAEVRYTKIDEIPFDCTRRLMSVVVDDGSGDRLLITKGAVEEVLDRCRHVRRGDARFPLTHETRLRIDGNAQGYERHGMRVLAVATRETRGPLRVYRTADETDLELQGLMIFLDSPKATAAATVADLTSNGVAVKIVTGDSQDVAAAICRQVGLDVAHVALGSQIDALTNAELSDLATTTTVFAKVDPVQKARIVAALQAADHTVGFLGDGINDAAALRDADIGISVDTAADIARESADVILLDKDLTVLADSITVGRTTFGNIMKYIKMTASSNFGNALSILAASVFLPFLPMLAVQLLVQNLLYDISQLAIPWDRMDPEYLRRPRTWNSADLRRFMLRIGPTSSIFDVTTFLIMWFVFNADTVTAAPLFQSGWFVEGLLSQTLIVHMIRTQNVPFLRSQATRPVMVLTGAIIALGIYLPFSPLAATLGLVALPWTYFPILALILLGYCTVVQITKRAYVRRYRTWL